MRSPLRGAATLIGRFSIRRQIGLAAAALCLLFVVSTAGIIGYLGAGQVSEMIRNDLAATSQVMADRLNRALSMRYQEVQTWSRFTPLRPLWHGNAAKLREALEELQASYPYYSWIGFADMKGTVISATDGILEGTSVAERTWFKSGLLGPSVRGIHDTLDLEKGAALRGSDEPFRFVDIAFPVHDAHGRQLGVLCAYLSWDFASNTRRSMIEAERSDVLDILILSRDGKVLLGGPVGSEPFGKDLVQRFNVESRGTLADAGGGAPKLVGFATVQSRGDYPGLGWIVVARQSAATALAPVQALIWTIGLIGLCTAAVGLALAWVIARGIARPLQALTAEADRLGRDPDATMLSRHGGSEEVTHLSTALRALLRRLSLAEHRTQAAELRAEAGAQQYAHDIQILRKMAETDPLTGLMNRRSFISAANDAFDYYRRYERGIATLVLDIDHFKRINDTYGHAAGDGVIKRVGEVAERSLRSTDKVARFGGEEFVILLREVGEDQAQELADRILETIAAQPVSYGKAWINVTASIGISIAGESDRDIQDTIERADRALYMAKNTGRNRAFLIVLNESDLRTQAA
jgi:diguanylate cyclase (GGDEF)-like protein